MDSDKLEPRWLVVSVSQSWILCYLRDPWPTGKWMGNFRSSWVCMELGRGVGRSMTDPGGEETPEEAWSGSLHDSMNS